jgi:hypothetical protein
MSTPGLTLNSTCFRASKLLANESRTSASTDQPRLMIYRTVEPIQDGSSGRAPSETFWNRTGSVIVAGKARSPTKTS